VGRAIVIKTTDREAVRALLWPLVTGGGVPPGVRIAVDVDPLEL
jgi:hypothetical protein